ncbi:MAG: hypothetical protein K6U80_20015 [Firmicutes bacterium]|nr:hypothetical protein [Bacillota bacterium]
MGNKSKFMIGLSLTLVTGLICYFGIILINNANANSNKQKGIIVDDLQLGKLKIGLLYNEVVEIMGDMPKKVEKDESAHMITLDYDDGTNIVIFANRVYDLSVISPKYSTPRGLKVGDNKDKVIQLYGQPPNTGINDSLWEFSNDEGSMYLTIFFKDDLVNMIEVNIPVD